MNTICLFASTQDVASMNMYECLKPQLGLSELVFDEYHICEGIVGNNKLYLVLGEAKSVDANGLDEELKKVIGEFDILLFLSKHASVSGIPSFCIHTQGNWDTAELGGSPKTLGVTPVVLKNALYREMVAKNTTTFDVVHEGTHHGPDLAVPAIFFEIGSTENEWGNSEYGAYMISVLLSVVEKYNGENSDLPVITGIGGSHTCSNFNRLSAEGKVLLGHVAPNYAVESLSSDLIKQAITKTTLGSSVIVDWKSLNAKMRAHVTSILLSAGVESEKLKVLKKRLDETA